LVGADGEEGADQHEGKCAPDSRPDSLAPVIAFEGRHCDQAEILHQQGDGDVEASDRQVIAELDPGQADPTEDRQGWEFPASDPQQGRPDHE